MDKNGIEIKESALADELVKADRWLKKATWKPKDGIFKDDEPGDEPVLLRTDFTEKTESVSLITFAQKISRHSFLLDSDAHFLMTQLRKALAIGIHINETYTKASGLKDLIAQKNTTGGLSDAQQTEFREKFRTSSFLAVFCTALYMKYELSHYRSEDLASIQLRFNGVPEISNRAPNQAIDCMIFYLGAYYEKTDRIRNGLEMVKMAQLYFDAFLEECLLQVESLKYVESFTNYRYKLEDTDFVIDSFNTDIGNGAVSVEFNRVSFDDIVGNQAAKHKAHRMIYRICCYDPERKRNPMKDLGALPILRSGFGVPGTGKGMQISATSTLMEHYVPVLVGIPYLFHPMPQSMVDSFQGNSGKKMHDWLKPFRNPNMIVYGPIDDAEQNLTDRSRRDCSAGQLELVQEFLPGIEGPTAVFFGNAFMEVFTNLPEKLDPAVLSRIQDRFELKGAENWKDFIDMDQLWLSKFKRVDETFAEEFVAMKDPKGYRYFDAQKLLGSLSELDEIREARNIDLREIMHRVEKERRVDERLFFARLFEEIKKNWSSFSPRDQRNIHTAVNERVFDFDFPQEWIDNPTIFFRLDKSKNYETKMKMIGELMRENMKGFSFSEVYRQEVIRYIDTWLLIHERGRERAIEEAIKRMDIELEAQKRIMNEKKEG